MKLKLLTFMIVFLPTVLFGQEINDSLLTTFYNKTISIYFSDSSYRHNPKFDSVLIETNFDTSGLIKNLGLCKFKYFDSTISIVSVLDKPLQVNDGRGYFWVGHTILSQDTVDLIIGVWTIEYKSRKKFNIGL